MNKTIEQLEKNACRYWPKEIADAVKYANPIALLVKTQDKFLSILKCAKSNPMAWLDVLKNSDLPANLFLKHLVVLADVGGERLQRFAKDLKRLFPHGHMSFCLKGNLFVYRFSDMAAKWTNASLNMHKEQVFSPHSMTDEMLDVCMLLLWGGCVASEGDLPVELIDKCVIGKMIGRPEKLEKFVRQRYIYVSKVTAGSAANDGGHLCEELCLKRLGKMLPSHITIGGHHVPGITQNEQNLTTFDIVVKNEQTNKYCAIEISFQVTTNSVIERKAQMAKERRDLLHKKGHKVAYVIDGAGNFRRRAAVGTLLKFSDCSVNFSDSGLSELAEYIVEALS